MQGKIIKGIGGFYYVHDGIGKVYECRAKGIFRNRGIKPLVGDDVEISVLDEEKATGNLDEILPRKNRLIRPAVSNVDQAVVVFAITDPMPNLNLLDRFLVMMERQEVPVSICFNKIDLVDAAEQEKLRAIYEPAGYPVHFISTYEKSGLEEFHRLIIGKTTVLAGPSGVGKSSITNFIQPEAQMETGGISEKIRRGKHTTRHSELFFVEEGTYMMDTPGFSSLYIEDLEPEALKDFFPEFEPYEDECRFLGCVHIGERECGVKTAVQEQKIGQSRYDNYRLMYQELKDHKVTFISMNEQFDTSTAIGEAMLKIILIFAELERNMTSERVTGIMLDRAEQGLWNGARMPVGYRWNPEIKFPEPDPEETKIVQFIFDEYERVRSTTKIARYLNHNQIASKRGGQWTSKLIRDIIRSPFYIGTYRYNLRESGRGPLKPESEWIVRENNHPAIITKETFGLV